MSTEVKTFFDHRAEIFDSLYQGNPVASRWNRIVRKALYDRFAIALDATGDARGKSVLDVGCGSGRYMTALARAGAGPLVGIDVAPEMIALARRLTAAEGLGDRCRFIEGDFLQSELDVPFDVVLAMGVFDYIEDPLPFLRKMVETSSGLVIASFPGRSLVRMRLRSFRYRCRSCPVFFYREPDLHALCREAGLEDYDLVFMPASGTGWVLVGRTRARSLEPGRIG